MKFSAFIPQGAEFYRYLAKINESITVNDIIQIYKKYYIDRDYEQVDLYRLLKIEFGIEKAIYPGSFVHISPSFIYPEVVYIDSDKKAKSFFKKKELRDYIIQRKEYSEDSHVEFYGLNYNQIQSKYIGYFDLLISQYSGFISEACKEYLKNDGILLVNNSHGDAGMASLDEDYKLTGTIHKTNGRYRVSYSSLDKYFIPKRNIKVTRECLYKLSKGVGYKNTAPLYVFSKLK